MAPASEEGERRLVDDSGYESLFNGKDLSGWFPTPRRYGTMWPGGPHLRDVFQDAFSDDYEEQAELHPAKWTVEDGAIVGRQNPPGCGYGGYLVSDEKFGDFELVLDARPDWPADTGIILRKDAESWNGIQVLLDHREDGGIGGFFGGGISGFHASAFPVDIVVEGDGPPTGLKLGNRYPSTPHFEPNPDLLTYAATPQDFLDVWKFDDWNAFRIRIVGVQPVVTTWVNDLKVAEIDLSTMESPNYDAQAASECLGREGHIGLEVHDNDPYLGEKRWGRDAACRWRNIRIKRL
jgi:hypothetical protein